VSGAPAPNINAYPPADALPLFSSGHLLLRLLRLRLGLPSRYIMQPSEAAW